MVILALILITLHAPDGLEIHINPKEVVAVREPRDSPISTLSKGVSCVLQTVDGKYISVVETCKVVVAKMAGEQ